MSETDIFDSKVGEILAIAIWAFAKTFYFVFATFANSVYYGSKFLSKFKNMKVFKQVKKGEPVKKRKISSNAK